MKTIKENLNRMERIENIMMYAPRLSVEGVRQTLSLLDDFERQKDELTKGEKLRVEDFDCHFRNREETRINYVKNNREWFNAGQILHGEYYE